MNLYNNLIAFLQSLGVQISTNQYNNEGVIQIILLDHSADLYFDAKLNLITLNNEDLDFDAFKNRIAELLQIDLFENYEALPDNVKLLIDNFNNNEQTYENCGLLVAELEKIGFTCDYGLDCVPIDLRAL